MFLLAGDLVKPEAAHTLMQLVAEGTGEDEEADAQLRKDAVESYASLLVDASSSSSSSPGQQGISGGGDGGEGESGGRRVLPAVLPDVLAQTMAWILGEYGYLLSERVPQEALVQHLAAPKGLARREAQDPATRGFVVSGVVKLVAQMGVWVGWWGHTDGDAAG